MLPVLVKGVGREQLPPPLHLLPAQVIPSLDGSSASFDVVATHIRDLVRTIARTPPRRSENDARRRLASAAAPLAIGSAAETYGLGMAIAASALFFALGGVLIWLLPETRGQELAH